MLRVRAYEEGAAFRYEILGGKGTPLFVNHETTEFHFSQSCGRLWLQDWSKTYEGPYNLHGWDDRRFGRGFGMPCLFLEGDAGVGGFADVYINGGESVKANLNGVGLWGAPKRNEILGREVLVRLAKAKNTIQITSDESILPHVREITVTPD